MNVEADAATDFIDLPNIEALPLLEDTVYQRHVITTCPKVSTVPLDLSRGWAAVRRARPT